MQWYWDNLSSYVVTALVIILGSAEAILTYGGLLLLVIRLIADTPRAYRVIKGWLK